MFKHNFIYTLKILGKNKVLIFWTFAFPIILGTFFFLAFSDIENNEKLDVFPIAIVENDNFNSRMGFKETFEVLSDDNNEDKLFDVSYVLEEDVALEMLENKDIVGYILVLDEPTVVVAKSGINETILQVTTDQILSHEKVLEDYIRKNGNSGLENFVKVMMDDYSYVLDNSNKNMSYTMVEYYTLIAMTCLYGGTLGLTALNQNLANMSQRGKRIEVSPSPKFKVVLSSILASFLISLIGLFLLFLFLVFLLKVDFGLFGGHVVLLAIVGNLAGLAIGVAIASCFKVKEGTKLGILLSVTMLGCFLAGMMGITMKYVVDKNVGWINMINPANLITDGFYSLYYYDTLTRYWWDLLGLLIFIGVMVIVSVLALRRNSYDSI